VVLLGVLAVSLHGQINALLRRLLARKLPV